MNIGSFSFQRMIHVPRGELFIASNWPDPIGGKVDGSTQCDDIWWISQRISFAVKLPLIIASCFLRVIHIHCMHANNRSHDIGPEVNPQWLCVLRCWLLDGTLSMHWTPWQENVGHKSHGCYRIKNKLAINPSQSTWFLSDNKLLKETSSFKVTIGRQLTAFCRTQPQFHYHYAKQHKIPFHLSN